jgi:hypothetical protein
MARKRKRKDVKRRCPEAAALARREFHQRVVANKKRKLKDIWRLGYGYVSDGLLVSGHERDSSLY